MPSHELARLRGIRAYTHGLPDRQNTRVVRFGQQEGRVSASVVMCKREDNPRAADVAQPQQPCRALEELRRLDHNFALLRSRWIVVRGCAVNRPCGLPSGHFTWRACAHSLNALVRHHIFARAQRFPALSLDALVLPGRHDDGVLLGFGSAHSCGHLLNASLQWIVRIDGATKFLIIRSPSKTIDDNRAPAVRVIVKGKA